MSRSCYPLSDLMSRLREQVQARIQAEVQGTGVEEEDTDCPICFDSMAFHWSIWKCGSSDVIFLQHMLITVA
jgi:ribosomal protein S27AE